MNDQPTTTPLAYSYPEAAQAVGYSTSHIRRMISEGYLKSITPAGSQKPVILREELERWVKSGE